MIPETEPAHCRESGPDTAGRMCRLGIQKSAEWLYSIFPSKAPFIFFPEEFRLQKCCPLLQPGDRLHGSDRDFPVSMMISINPNIQQQFRNPAKEPGLKVIVFHKVHLFLQRKEHREQEGTVRIQQLFLHDEHVEHVRRGGFHMAVKSRQVFRKLRGNDSPCFIQIRSVMGMAIMRSHAFNHIVAFFRENDICILQQLFRFGRSENRIKRCLSFFLSLEMPAVMRQANIVSIQIFPGPVQACQFTVIGIKPGNILSLIIPLKAYGKPSGSSHLDWKVHGIFRHCIGFMGCNNGFDQWNHLNFRMVSPPVSAENSSQ